jgi:hypothetical protein
MLRKLLVSHRFPNDADGDALRRVAADGSDMTEPMVIDYFVEVPDQTAAQRVAEAAAAAAFGFRTAVKRDAGTGSWTCYCSKRMPATYDRVVEAQGQLGAISRPFGGRVDGWGSCGNA